MNSNVSFSRRDDVNSSPGETKMTKDTKVVAPCQIEKYRKLKAMGMPQTKIRARMQADGVDPNLLFTPSLSKYQKLLQMGMPKSKISTKMIKDGIDPTLLFGSSSESPQAVSSIQAPQVETKADPLLPEQDPQTTVDANNKNKENIRQQSEAKQAIHQVLDPTQKQIHSDIRNKQEKKQFETTVPKEESDDKVETKTTHNPIVPQTKSYTDEKITLDPTQKHIHSDNRNKQENQQSEQMNTAMNIQDLGISIDDVYYSVSDLRAKASSLKQRHAKLLERAAIAKRREAAAEALLAQAAQKFITIKSAVNLQLSRLNDERKRRQQYVETVRTKGSAALQLEFAEARWAETLASKRRQGNALVQATSERVRQEISRQSKLILAKRESELNARLDAVQTETVVFEAMSSAIVQELETKRSFIQDSRAQAIRLTNEKESRERELKAHKDHNMQELIRTRVEFKRTANYQQARALLDNLRDECWPYSEAAHAFCTVTAKKLQVRVHAQAVERKRDCLNAKIQLINSCLKDPESILQHSNNIVPHSILTELSAARRAFDLSSEKAISLTPGAKRLKQRAASSRLKTAAKATIESLKRDRIIYITQREAAEAALLMSLLNLKLSLLKN